MTDDALRPFHTGGGSGLYNLCRFPGCDNFAVTTIRRGEVMSMMHVCPQHRLSFYGLTDRECREIDWQDRRRVTIGAHKE